MKIEDLVENVLNILCKSIEVFLKALLVFGFLAIGRYVVVESMDYFDIYGLAFARLCHGVYGWFILLGIWRRSFRHHMA